MLVETKIVTTEEMYKIVDDHEATLINEFGINGAKLYMSTPTIYFSFTPNDVIIQNGIPVHICASDWIYREYDGKPVTW